MKAIMQDTYGDADVLRLADVPPPVAGRGEVLIRVHAAGTGPEVWHLMTGLPLIGRPAFGLRRPRMPVSGVDVAGHIEAVGPGVTGFRPGDRVFGVGVGTFAELTRAKATKIAHVPDGVDLTRAAACPVSAVTALQGLRDAGRLRPGHRVLIFGAGGGIGTFAVQLARHLGAAEVTGVCRDAKADLVRSLGATLEVDGRYDVILDTGGLRPLRTVAGLLTSNGRAVLAGGEGGSGRLFSGMDRQLKALVHAPWRRQRFVPLVAVTRRADLETIAGLLADGTLRPVVDRTFPLAEAPDAIRYVATGRTRGKVVVAVAG